LTITDFVVGQVCLLAWREGKRLKTGRDGMLGIAHVIHNRVMAGWNSSDWLKTIHDWPLHSANLVEELDFQSLPDLRDADFNWLVPRVEQIYSGALRDSITGNPSMAFALPQNDALGKRPPLPVTQCGLFWADLNNITRPWFKENIIGARDQHSILAHSFPLTFIG